MKEKFFDGLLSRNDKFFKGILSKRKNDYIYESIHPELLNKYLSNNWEVEKHYKSTVKVKKKKAADIKFEDQVWALFAELGFSSLNKDRHLKIHYSNDSTLTQQIDIFAVDDETIILVECKATEGERKKGNFKEAIEAIGGKKDGIIKTLRQFFPASKHKIKFIFATKNYSLTKQDEERLNHFGIEHFDEDVIKYYEDLAKHLGSSAKFQLLGNLFEGITIPNLENKVPAIKGKMGGHTYYSFSIEPEKLLKICYVLHRNKANKKSMPTYQRIIKKSRLKDIHEFLEEGGFFPNSIIININASNKDLVFDQANTQVENAISKVGILHLPKNYKSAFIIDGQHRLYGYANSKYKISNSIPVVAFADLDRNEQIRLFMDINENQKAVSRDLKNTLNVDLLWDSNNLQERVKALQLRIAQDLGEELDSPLYDRVIIGENPKTNLRYITTEFIKIGLDKSNFFGQVNKSSIKKDGTFYNSNNDETYELLLPFLKECFNHIKNNLHEEWNKGEEDNAVIVINPGITSLIRIFSDIIDHLIKTDNINPKADKLDNLLEKVQYYLDPLIDYYKNLTEEDKTTLRTNYGGGGQIKYWRNLQKAINTNRPDFNPEGLTKYWKDEAKQYNEDSFRMIRDIETHLKNDFKDKLNEYHGSNWFKKGVPPSVQDDAVLLQQQKNREVDRKEEEVEAWDCLNIIDYRKIAIYGKNWQDIFAKHYTKPGEEKISGGKEEKTKWLQSLERIRNHNFHSYSVKEEEYEFLSALYEWLVEGKS